MMKFTEEDKKCSTFDDLRNAINFIKNDISADIYCYILDTIDELEIKYES